MKLWEMIARITFLAALITAGNHVAAAGTLQRSEIKDAKERGAVCNDFSHAIYYLDLQPDSRGWVIFLEGGGGCSSFSECNERWTEDGGRNQPLMSSSPPRFGDFPVSVTGRDILSSDPSQNPLFCNYSHVVVPYCSSDAWLANRSNPTFDNGGMFRFNESPDADNFVYRGKAIFQAVIEDLIELGLRNASELILSGSSSGGVGALNHLDWVQEQLENIDILTVIDSSWFIPFRDYHVVNWSVEIAQRFNIDQPACLDMSLGFPCCTSPACLFTKEYIPRNSSPIFVVSSTYDIFTLKEALRRTIRDLSNDDDQTLLRVFNEYGSLINQGLDQSFTVHQGLSIFAPSCSQHVYLATSSLWDSGGILSATLPSTFQEAAFRVQNLVESGNWDIVRIVTDDVDFTLRQALQQWYRDVRSSNSPFFYTDTCNGPVCSKCPSDISLVPQTSIWPVGFNVFVLILSALMTLIPLATKLGIYFHMKYLLYRQRVYAYGVNQSVKMRPHFPRATHPVNVSCSGLYYRIDVVNRPKFGSATDYSPSLHQYELYTQMEMFLPCLKPLWSRCFRESPPSIVGDPGECNNCLVDLPRADSGISSSLQMQRGVPGRESQVTVNSTVSTNSTVSLIPTSTTPLSTNINKKTILHQVNLYINPGELVAIMGPSGSGKTTLLDVLLGRRSEGSTQGQIFINGVSLSKMRNWFVLNTGYVRQMAMSFYNELTVRENLLFTMMMQAPTEMKLEQKLERVEQVIRETGLIEQADIKVGDGMGLGLSGGQRKRLAIAVQLLSMPNIIFLDEPTSGLDSASSLEILKSLQVLSETGRAIVVTIHQPRSEIFFAFDKILLLCNGQVAFFGSPVCVWDFFMSALEVTDDKLASETSTNQADAILDLLKAGESQSKVLRAYKSSGEPKKVRAAVLEAREESDSTPPAVYSRYPGLWARLVAMEARASLRQAFFSIIYLPIVYLVFGTILGTTYLFTNNAVQIMSVTCLLSCSSSLFMSSIVSSLLVEPLKLFRLEHSDGIACTHELILQVFIRMSALCTLPLAVCATIVFGLVYQNYTFEVYLVLLLAFLLVNQAWISLFIVLTVTYPQQAHRLCPVFAAIGGFCCGFIVPKPLMPSYYRWIFYINPSFFAYASTSVTVLKDNDLGCSRDSTLECFQTSGVAVLDKFGLSEVNPIENLVVLMAMTIIFVGMGVAILWAKVNFPIFKEKVMKSFYKLAKRKRRRRVTDTSWPGDAINGVIPNHSAVKLTRVRTHTGVVESTDADEEERHSSHFLEQGFHQLFHSFPWERVLGQDTIDIFTLTSPPPSGRRSPFAGRGVLPSNSTSTGGGMRRGVEELDGGLGETLSLHSEHIINMEEEQDERERRRIASLKWTKRRERMESEFLRLRHRSRMLARATRHSVAVCSVDSLEGVLDRTAHSTEAGSPLKRVGSKCYRSVSVPAPFEPPPRRMVPTLEAHQEDEENLDCLGLPPKDIPGIGESSEDLDHLDVEEIPLEEVPFSDWNTDDDVFSSDEI